MAGSEGSLRVCHSSQHVHQAVMIKDMHISLQQLDSLQPRLTPRKHCRKCFGAHSFFHGKNEARAAWGAKDSAAYCFQSSANHRTAMAAADAERNGAAAAPEEEEDLDALWNGGFQSLSIV